MTSRSPAPEQDRDFTGFALGQLPFQAVLAAHPSLARALKPYNPAYTASLVSGLLTLPELQSNCVRLEVLAQLAVAAGAGTKRSSKTMIAGWFEQLGRGPSGISEDPAEDAFTSVVTSERGNFRIFPGIWESAAFYLQRIVNLVERTPGETPWLALRESVFALLKLSDLVCERAGLGRYEFGSAAPAGKLPMTIQQMVPALRHRVTFTIAELKEHGISTEQLAPFILDPELRPAIPESSLAHSPLLYHPLLLRDDQLIVALPAALSIAIRGLVAGSLVTQGLKGEFLTAIAHEYEDFFTHNPPLGVGPGAPIQFQPTDHGVMASFAHEMDVGRYLQFIFVLDTLEGFEESAFAGANPNPQALTPDFDKWTDACQTTATERANFRAGMTVIVGCGIGRAACHQLSSKRRDGWRSIYLSAPDVSTLSDLGKTDAKTLWRILDGEDRLRDHGVDLLNVNGVLNLVAWVRSLDGHLVEHGQIPTGWGGGRECCMMIDATRIRELRRDVAQKLDRHAVPSPDGQWIVVRKLGTASFAENQATPLFVSSERRGTDHLPMVYESGSRCWWCHVVKPRNYARWKLMTTWVPRIAPVLDAEIPSLPGILSIHVFFEGYNDHPQKGEEILSLEDIQADIHVTVDIARRVIELSIGSLFEQGLAQPSNVSEKALVTAIVDGCLKLAGCPAGVVDRHTLTETIVPDEPGPRLPSVRGKEFSRLRERQARTPLYRY